MVRLNVSIHPSLSEIVIECLRRRNVITIVDFIANDSIKLATSSGLSHTDVLQIKQHILNRFGGTKRNAAELFAAERTDIIPTNIICLDKLLKGGLNLGQLYEICGSSSSGKTQLCLTITAVVTATRLDVVAWYFDTKRDFSRLRFEEILRAKNFRQEVVDEILQRIKVCCVCSFSELIRALQQLINLCKTEQQNRSSERKRFLVIIDSLPVVIFKLTRHARKNDHETTYELNDLAESCRFLAKECRAAVITVNSTTCWNSSEETDRATVIPALGKYWARVPAMRLFLIRQQNETRRITVWKDLRLDSEELYCNVTVSEAGVIAK